MEGFIEIRDSGNGGNFGDGMKLLRHDVVARGQGGHHLACRVYDRPCASVSTACKILLQNFEGFLNITFSVGYREPISIMYCTMYRRFQNSGSIEN